MFTARLKSISQSDAQREWIEDNSSKRKMEFK